MIIFIYSLKSAGLRLTQRQRHWKSLIFLYFISVFFFSLVFVSDIFGQICIMAIEVLKLANNMITWITYLILSLQFVYIFLTGVLTFWYALKTLHFSTPLINRGLLYGANRFCCSHSVGTVNDGKINISFRWSEV